MMLMLKTAFSTVTSLPSFSSLNLTKATKRRARARVPSAKLQASVAPASLSVQRLLKSPINTPRQIRVALLAAKPRKAIVSKLEDGPVSPNQPSTRNPLTGKVALGPWNGPFAAHPATDEPVSLMYIDPRGVSHFELTDRQSQELKRAPSQAGSLQDSTESRPSSVPSRRDRKGFVSEMVHLQEKVAQRNRVTISKGAAARMQKVQQPRRQH